MPIDFHSISDIGARSNQEDSEQTNYSNDGLLLVLADGMGGHEAGEVASSLAVVNFEKAFLNLSQLNANQRLIAALQSANDSISNKIDSNPKLDGMGTTLLATYVNGNKLEYVSVGDSPLFLFRDGRLSQVNDDHSMMPVILKSLREGKITEEEAKNHPQRNALRSVVMGEKIEIIDSSKSPTIVKTGDIIVSCSDGLQTLTNEKIEKILSLNAHQPSSIITSALMDAVKKERKPKQDNTTIQVAKIISVKDIKGKSNSSNKSSLFILFLSIFVIALVALALFIKFDDSEVKQKSIEPIKLNESESIDDSKKESNDLPIFDDQSLGEQNGDEKKELLKREMPSESSPVKKPQKEFNQGERSNKRKDKVMEKTLENDKSIKDPNVDKGPSDKLKKIEIENPDSDNNEKPESKNRLKKNTPTESDIPSNNRTEEQTGLGSFFGKLKKRLESPPGE